MHDVIVLGSGLAGSLTATILARHGHDVLMLEKGSHPRMAIGESLLPATAMWFWILGQKHGIPEITTLSHLESICKNIAPRCGAKRGFGYIYHREGQPAVDPDNASNFISPLLATTRESQFYRQDTDEYMVRAAQTYGVTYRDRTTVVDVDIDEHEARVHLADGAVVKGRLLIDATGRHSILAEKFGLRESPPRQRHASRTIFAHLRGVRTFDAIAPEVCRRRRSATWSEGTLHHLFDRGWFWVIPFNNHRLSENDIVSVGLTLDANVHPALADMTPEEEFWRFVRRFPVVQRQLRDASAVRGFVGTGRLQYSSSRCTGDRYILLHHAYGFLDPLFSRGLWRTLETLDSVVDRVLPALRSDTLDAAQFEYIERMQASMLDDNDQLIYNAFRSLRSGDTWAAFIKVWFADELLMTLMTLSAVLKYVGSGEASSFDMLSGEPRPCMEAPYAADLQALLDRMEQLLDRFDAGTIGSGDVYRSVCRMLSTSRSLPQSLVDWSARQEFGLDLVPPRLLRLLWWGRVKAPRPIRQQVFDFSIRTLANLQLRAAVYPQSLARDVLGNVVNQR